MPPHKTTHEAPPPPRHPDALKPRDAVLPIGAVGSAGGSHPPKLPALAPPAATPCSPPATPAITPASSPAPTPAPTPADPAALDPAPPHKTMHVAPPLSRSHSLISIASSTAAQAAQAQAQADKETWDRTLSRAIKGIVSIKATATRAFDTESAGDYTATGFVISKHHGLILSNRHVVNPAPITSVAVFVNYEEVPVFPVYRDPIHDFGVFRYDPAALRHMDVEEIELCPDAAHVGEDIRVVGNDAGEKLSVRPLSHFESSALTRSCRSSARP